MWRFVLVFLFFPMVAQAEPVRVSAGEHSEFTRVILEFPDVPQWQARRRGNSYRVTFSSLTPLSFDLSRVFRLIDRSRVGDVRAIGGNAIEIDLACNCDVRLSQSGQGAVVVDIHPFDQSAPATQAAVDQMMPPMESDVAPARPTMEPVAPVLGLPADVEMPDLPEEFSGTNNVSFDFEPSSTTGQVSVELLGRAFSRAAVQGLVSAEDVVAPREDESTLQQLRRLGGRQNLSVTTSFDRVTKPDAAALSPTMSGRQCLGDRQIDVASWGDTGDRDALGRLRGAAVSEDGSVDADGAAELAKFYIHLGFGAEAQIAAKYMPPSDEREILFALADVLDNGASTSPVFQGQAACDGIVSLWSILAQPLDAASAPDSAAPALAAFSALPSHLRTHLGPLLSERLHAVGLQEEARTAINAVTRGGIQTDESELATARLELEGTHADEARDVLSDLSNGTDLTAAAALLELLEDAEERGMAPNPSWVDDAPTLVGALEGTEIAEKLNIAGLRGQLALGRFDEFRAALIDDAPGLTDETRRDLAVLALQSALTDGPDDAFIKAEIGLGKIVSANSLPNDLRRGLARRLHEIGLSQRAVAYIDALPEDRDNLETAVGALLATGDIEAALSLVEQSAVTNIADLRARTLVGAGQDSPAVSAFVDAGDTESAAMAALRVAEWAWLAENAEAPVADATRSLTMPIPTLDTETETPNGALIDAARDRRQSVRSLLELTRPSMNGSAFTN